MSRRIIFTDGSCWNGNYDSSKTTSSGFALILDDDLNIIDHFISVKNHGTSNLAEINIIFDTVVYLMSKGIFEIHVHTDSEYAIKVLTKTMNNKHDFFGNLFREITKKRKIVFSHLYRESDFRNSICDKNAGKIRKMFDNFLNDNNLILE